MKPAPHLANLNLNEVFWTFQGEGFHTGKRALFVRFPFCNLKCSWCDTAFNTYDTFEVDRFIKIATQEKARFAVLTGGEPSMNKQTPQVIEILKTLGFKIAIESNGTFPIPDEIDWVTISPKKDAHFIINDNAWRRADEFKYVVDQKFLFEILDRHNTKDGRHYYLSPEFSEFKTNLEQIFAYIKVNPDWKISLQTHKWMGVR